MTGRGASAVFTERVPERLRQRVEEIVAASGAEHTAVPERILRVVVDATRELLDHHAADRRTALDLLAVDALVTRALESMAEDPERFEARCLEALRMLSTTARSP
ncbi:MAG: hypothetical protein ACT4P7_04130 [Gemmatimonadaceae bacterium]